MVSIHVIKIWANTGKPVLLNSTHLFPTLSSVKKKITCCSVNMSCWSNSYKQFFTHNEMPALLYCFPWLITLDLWTYFWSYLDLGRIFKHALCSQDHVKGTIRKKTPQQNVFLGFSAQVSMFCVPEWYSDYWKLSLPLYLRAHRLQVWGGRKKTHPDTFLKSYNIWRCYFL